MLNNKSYRRSLHTILHDYIPEDIIEEGNKKLSLKYGYIKEHDLIVISKDGTLGQILEIENLKKGLPKEPKQSKNTKKFIRFFLISDVKAKSLYMGLILQQL